MATTVDTEPNRDAVDKAAAELVAEVRDARSDAMVVSVRVANIVTAGDVVDQDQRAKAVVGAIARLDSSLSALAPEHSLGAYADRIEKLSHRDEVVGVYGEGGTRLRGALDEAQGDLPTVGIPLNDAVEKAHQASDELYAVVRDASVLAVSYDIRRQLDDKSAGQSIDVDDMFSQYGFLKPEDVAKVFTDVTRYPGLEDAWVDVSARRIYKLPERLWPKMWRLGLQPVVTVLLFVAAAAAGEWVLADDHPLSSWRWMCEALAVVLAGALFHAAANAWKRRKMKSQLVDSVIVVSQWGTWIKLHPFVVLWLLFAPVVTFVALVWRETDFRHLTGAAVFFLAGYSCDSVVRALLPALDEAAAKTVKTFKPSKPADT
jgi:hypothetical protein